ncbi:hypothetical protein FS749_015336 [Ceratobasidium sp. UAMH 11750]|nr:hypothetical protein FS749_015336 [Ceratobasidium sp. UAMH 11750]
MTLVALTHKTYIVSPTASPVLLRGKYMDREMGWDPPVDHSAAVVDPPAAIGNHLTTAIQCHVAIVDHPTTIVDVPLSVSAFLLLLEQCLTE